MKKIIISTLLFLLLFSGIDAQIISKADTKLKNKPNSKHIESPELKIDRRGLFGPKIAGVFSLMASGIGPAYLFGDIGGSKQEQILNGINDWKILNTSFLYSLGAHHLFPSNFGVKASIYYGQFSGDDQSSRNNVRGYAFKSNITEFTLQGEYVFWGGPNSRRNNPHCWYVFAGVGLLHNSTELKYRGIVITSPPTDRTQVDGSTDKINLSSFAPVIPVGLGYKFRFSPKLTFGAEFGWHTIQSDYADGILPLNSKSNDVLASLTLTFSYKIYGSVNSMTKRVNADW